MISFLFFCCLSAGISLGVQINQSPSAVIRKTGENVQLVCTHGQSDYRVMLWYQQLPGDNALKLIGYGYTQFKNDSVEEPFRKHFKLAGDLSGNNKNGSLSIINLKALEHSAVYFCAARGGSYTEAYFGAGTKLTVLEKDPKPPKVEVLRPSPKECKNGQRNKTLVCVATGFYPDHVSLSWQINGVGVTKGVATDEAAQWMPGERFYQITSRLRVSEEDWYNPKKQFNCTVNFYNGSDTVPYIGSISGKANTITRGEYLKITQSAKLTYGVFIAKSCIYGAFVAFLVWKLQGSNGKQNY